MIMKNMLEVRGHNQRACSKLHTTTSLLPQFFCHSMHSSLLQRRAIIVVLHKRDERNRTGPQTHDFHAIT